jgi:hypothetical protein
MSGPNFVNATGNTLGGTFVGNTLVFNYTVGVGNNLILLIYLNSGLTVNSVTDSLGNNWAVTGTLALTGFGSVAIASIVSNALPGHTITVTITCSAAVSFSACQLNEYANAGSVLTLLIPTAQPPGVSFSQAISGAVANSLIYSAFYANNTVTQGSGFTLRS